MRHNDVSISDIGLALLMLDQERKRNDMAIFDIEVQIRALQDRLRLIRIRNEAIDDTIKRVRSAA